MVNNTLVVRQGNCPPSCTLCVEACDRRAGGNGQTVLEKIDLPEVNYHSVLTCNQCSQPECAAVCPTGALSLSETGSTVHDKQRCVGCGMCNLVCPYGGIHMDGREHKSYRCDSCEGAPECAKACPNGILAYEKAGEVMEQLGDDYTTLGLPYCAGCGMELIDRFTLRTLGRNIVLFGAPGCNVLGSKTKVPYYGSLMTNHVSSATGVSRYFQRIGKDTLCVEIIGDGATADIGFGALSAAAERGEKILYICYDNEAYMNTGIQRSSTTPFGGWTNTTQVGKKGRGKRETSKNVPLLMAFHNIRYAATAVMGYPDDYMRKLLKAREAAKEGMAYIHILSPCPTGWKCTTEDSVEITRAAVQTNYFPLWEAERGVFRLTHEVRDRLPIRAFTDSMERFAHLSPEELAELQRNVDNSYEQIRRITLAS